MPTIITIGSTKGGTGKTTIATNLAVGLSLLGKTVRGTDADAQQSFTTFAGIRKHLGNRAMHPSLIGKLPFKTVEAGLYMQPTLHETMPHVPADVVLIDVGGFDNPVSRSAFACSDVLLIPIAVGTFDMWALENIVKIAIQAKSLNPKMQIRFILNRVRNTKVSQLCRTEIEKLVNFAPVLTEIGDRTAIPEATSCGLSVLEFVPTTDRASCEIFRLVQQVSELIETA